ncbi:PREDICTED: uncharacterized protein LOC109592516 [Amphimedon queenslandica]|uniref:Uncharacterized protein n=1 Tax=Amphimedon queenslandica TaxID=400682 RepID=A0A1X7SL75_AMPQE|nr:PREDICTED: uncharacterized protein LOC109592516 [Amphimedon queenslandica]|eukprot:XP_019863507.1 PREDICTED: uncharacterized protein LOC109592516 [Amphimedon queenslandica]
MQQSQKVSTNDVLVQSTFRKVKSVHKNHSSHSKSSPVPLSISLNGGAALTRARLTRHSSLPVSRNQSSPSTVSFTIGEGTGSTTLAPDASTSSGSTLDRRLSRRLSESASLPMKQEWDRISSSRPRGSLPTIQHHLSSYSSRIASKSFWSIEMLMDREREMSETHSTKSLPSISNEPCTAASNNKGIMPTTGQMMELKHSKSDIHLETRDLSPVTLKGAVKSKQNQTSSTAAASLKSKRRISLQHLPPTTKK